jgi:AcrR family transcriptional regulator
MSPASGPATVERRQPGRPRSEAADEAILEATVDLLADAGLEGLTVEAVAARAGVGKGTIYRRHENKVDLVVHAVRSYSKMGEPPPDTGSTRGDLRALVDGFVAVLTETPLGRLVPILTAARSRMPELDAASSAITSEGRARSAAVVQRGIDRGDLRTDVDVDVVVDAFLGAVFYRFLITDAPLDERFRTELVDGLLRAFAV